MTNSLTPEQIAQGWKLNNFNMRGAQLGQPVPMEAMVAGMEPNKHVGGLRLKREGPFRISRVFSDKETFMWERVFAYRTFSPDLPSPPVSGEAVKLPRKFNPNHGWAHAMQADEPAFLLRYDDPERQDVTFTGYGAEEAALKMWEVANNSWNCALFKTMRTAPLSASITGDKG